MPYRSHRSRPPQITQTSHALVPHGRVTPQHTARYENRSHAHLVTLRTALITFSFVPRVSTRSSCPDFIRQVPLAGSCCRIHINARAPNAQGFIPFGLTEKVPRMRHGGRGVQYDTASLQKPPRFPVLCNLLPWSLAVCFGNLLHSIIPAALPLLSHTCT